MDRGGPEAEAPASGDPPPAAAPPTVNDAESDEPAYEAVTVYGPSAAPVTALSRTLAKNRSCASGYTDICRS